MPLQIRRRQAHLALAATLTTTTLLALLLRRFPPDQSSFYPTCPIHQLIGLLCPGCGATRALAALLHGSLTEAWHSNALIVLLLPVALACALSAYSRAATGRPIRWPHPPATILYPLFALVGVFTLLRNLR